MLGPLEEESLVSIFPCSAAAFQSILGTTPNQHFIVVNSAYGNDLFGSAIFSWKVSGDRKVKCHIDSEMLTWLAVDMTLTNSSNVIQWMAFYGSYAMHTYLWFSWFPSLSFLSCSVSYNVLTSEVEILSQQRVYKLGLCRHKVWECPCRVWHRTTILVKKN